MVRKDYEANVVSVVTDASGECRKACHLLSKEYPDIVFLDCYSHQVCSPSPARWPVNNPVPQINLVVGDYFKSAAGVLQFADAASELIVWLHSKTLILALIRVIQQALPGAGDFKAIIRAVLTRWTMHYQAFWRLGELHDVIIVVVRDNEKKPANDRNLITGNARAKAKATEMVNLIKTPAFWDALSVYVVTRLLVMTGYLMIGWVLSACNFYGFKFRLLTKSRFPRSLIS